MTASRKRFRWIKSLSKRNEKERRKGDKSPYDTC